MALPGPGELLLEVQANAPCGTDPHCRSCRAGARDTFPDLEGAATEGVETDLATQAAQFEAAATDAGRNPATIRRSTWIGGDRITSEAAFERFVSRHVALGFTDLTIGPPAEGSGLLERIGSRTLPRLRAQHTVTLEESHAVRST